MSYETMYQKEADEERSAGASEPPAKKRQLKEGENISVYSMRRFLAHYSYGIFDKKRNDGGRGGIIDDRKMEKVN